jgi:uncharacterized protein YyaL (SSP411 family)
MNHLSKSTSPYLLQHAHNPVDWYPWGEEALSKAKREDRPIFLSIGYSACHWCHVMAHESFEDPEIAAFMNDHFVNIKVDREERPDIDSIYMQATIAMTGSGGWPMSIFLAPDLKPFFTGTYFPPQRRYSMPAFKDILGGLANAWKNDKIEIEKAGDQILAFLQNKTINEKTEMLSLDQLDTIADAMIASYDWGFGGWGEAPKFPQAMTLEFLLQHLILAKDKMEKSEKTLKLINHCLQAMVRGGMYDVVGGGFSRYSTDKFWRVPHFEKMLYDNALLARMYLHAWQVTRDPNYKRIVEQTLGFIMREMTHRQGGFYSSLDADSDGKEGKFYVWSIDEIREVLTSDSDFFIMAYGITANGNWEGKTVLHRKLDDASLATELNIDLSEIPNRLAACHTKLYSARSLRVRPATDDKILSGWNGLMIAAFAEAARVMDNKVYLDMAIRSSEFLLSSGTSRGKIFRSWRNDESSDVVFLEDFAALILGFLELYQSTLDNKWFALARELTEEMLEKFKDADGGFFDTPNDSESILIRPKELTDNATPAGNSLACEALLKLAAYSDDGKYKEIAEQSLMLLGRSALEYPLGFARALSVIENSQRSLKQLAILGETNHNNYKRMVTISNSQYLPGLVIAASSYPPAHGGPELLSGRPLLEGKPTAYLCEGFVCRQPTNDPDELTNLLRIK